MHVEKSGPHGGQQPLVATGGVVVAIEVVELEGDAHQRVRPVDADRNALGARRWQIWRAGNTSAVGALT